MKTRKFYCKFFLALMIAGFVPGSTLLAQQYEKSRNITKVYPATGETSVQILNKYGNVHILPWDEDSIRFEISIKVEANKQSKVEKTYDNIEIEFSESSYYVIAQTVLGNQKNAFWADVSDFTNSMLKNGSNAQIDYTVYVPSNNELNIENKFGNVYMTDHSGKVILNVSNGDFRGGSFGILELDHSFGNVVIDTMLSGSLTLSYSELKLRHADDIRISSKSSKPNIGSFKSIRLNSKRDTYFFEDAGLINGETSFSYITIQNLEGDLILNTNYGNLSVDHFGNGFSMMNLAASYTDISMICGQGFDYFLEVYHNSKTRMIYPKDPPIFVLKEAGSEEGDFLLSGHAGASTENIPRLKITINGGSVNLVHL
jgi:hypothetical protein